MSNKHFELYLIRHGKTRATEKKLYCGNTELSLSGNGRRELQKYRASYPICQGYFSSGMTRCNETLEIILTDESRLEIGILPLLKELNVGIFDMKSYEDLKENSEYIKWINDKTGDYKPPAGESKNAFYGRVNMGFLSLTARIIQAGYKNAICVTHGGVIVAIMQGLFANFNSNKNFREWQPEPLGGYKLIHSGEEGYSHFEVFEPKVPL
ncbi:MAG: histidine phosphatase family protein [Defluviitaleaceae bacterium]|nr:histidine phosphatase family protein [Defluviitaleaceae bacterium]